MFPSTFYEHVDPTYLKGITNLEKECEKLEKDGNVEACQSLLQTFSENYLMPRELWDKFFRHEYHNTLTKFADQAYYQFYVTKDILTVCSLRRFHKLLNIQKTFKTNDIYPHSDLQNALKMYEKNSCSPVSKSIIQEYSKMLDHYETIKSVEENDVKWFKALMEVGDEEFLEQNVEYRLGQDLTNKKLWKLYIEFLISRNSKKLLHTYSKYCRFWLDDVEMKEEYQKADETYGPIKVSWKNSFDFEIPDISATKEFLIEQNKNNISRTLCKNKRRPSSDLYFSFSNALPQRFPFRPNLMAYIWKHSNGTIRQKLFMTCKYFFSKHPTPICYKLALGYNDRYVEYYQQQSVIVKCNYLLKFRVENFHVTTSLCVRDSYLLNLLSSFIPQIYQCDVKFIEIWNQYLSFEELKFLMGSGNVEELIFNDVHVRNDDKTDVPLEDVLIMAPKIQIIKILPPHLTDKTSQNLLNLSFIHKFHTLNLVIDSNLEPIVFAEFIKKNVASNCDLKFHCKRSFSIEKREIFEQILKGAMEKHWKCKDKPKLQM